MDELNEWLMHITLSKPLSLVVQAEGEQLGDRFAGSRFIQRWQQRIGVTLQRGNAVALIRRSRADHRRASGQRGRPVAFDHV